MRANSHDRQPHDAVALAAWASKSCSAVERQDPPSPDATGRNRGRSPSHIIASQCAPCSRRDRQAGPSDGRLCREPLGPIMGLLVPLGVQAARERRMFSVFRAHAAPRVALMFTSGPAHGEGIGRLEADPSLPRKSRRRRIQAIARRPRLRCYCNRGGRPHLRP